MNFYDELSKHAGHEVIVSNYEVPEMVSLICKECNYLEVFSFDKEGKEITSNRMAKERIKTICKKLPELLWVIKSDMTMFSHYNLEKQQYTDRVKAILESLFPYIKEK